MCRKLNVSKEKKKEQQFRIHYITFVGLLLRFIIISKRLLTSKIFLFLYFPHLPFLCWGKWKVKLISTFLARILTLLRSSDNTLFCITFRFSLITSICVISFACTQDIAFYSRQVRPVLQSFPTCFRDMCFRQR